LPFASIKKSKHSPKIFKRKQNQWPKLKPFAHPTVIMSESLQLNPTNNPGIRPKPKRNRKTNQ
ncbi:hypothetical protein, partial [Aureimonas fodinaquatilis]|uniref:hypothetical protein n=1 Tax=Aureimonas fodinaquatilis TaxID=2565783 RepID=UPI001AEEEF97